MKKNINKISVFLFGILALLQKNVYCNMTIEAMNESDAYYQANHVAINSTSILNSFLISINMLLLIALPVWSVVYFLKAKKNENNKVKNKKMGVLLFSSFFITIIFTFLGLSTGVSKFFSSYDKHILLNLKASAYYAINIAILLIRIIVFEKKFKNKKEVQDNVNVQNTIEQK